MPYSGRVHVTIGDHRLEDVEYVWEDMYSPTRRGQTGWGGEGRAGAFWAAMP